MMQGATLEPDQLRSYTYNDITHIIHSIRLLPMSHTAPYVCPCYRRRPRDADDAGSRWQEQGGPGGRRQGGWESGVDVII